MLTKDEMQARLDRVMLQMQLIADVAEAEQLQKMQETEVRSLLVTSVPKIINVLKYNNGKNKLQTDMYIWIAKFGKILCRETSLAVAAVQVLS